MKKIVFGLIATFIMVNFGYSQIKVEDYFYLGEIHNKALDYVVNNIDDSKLTKNVDTNVEYINGVLNSFYKLNNFDNSNSNRFSYFVVEDNFFNYFNGGADAYKNLSNKGYNNIVALNESFGLSNNQPSYQALISSLVSKSIIDSYEESTFNKLNVIVNNNKTGRINPTEILNELNKIKNDFNSKKYDKSKNNGHLLAITLALSIKSMEWWVKNESLPFVTGENYKLLNRGPNGDIILENNMLIAPWAAADIAGGIIGGVGAACASYIGSGSVNWTSVGVGCIWGAVAGSTGAVGRLAKLFR